MRLTPTWAARTIAREKYVTVLEPVLRIPQPHAGEEGFEQAKRLAQHFPAARDRSGGALFPIASKRERVDAHAAHHVGHWIEPTAGDQRCCDPRLVCEAVAAERIGGAELHEGEHQPVEVRRREIPTRQDGADAHAELSRSGSPPEQRCKGDLCRPACRPRHSRRAVLQVHDRLSLPLGCHRA
jgi:hypothetical protein